MTGYNINPIVIILTDVNVIWFAIIGNNPFFFSFFRFVDVMFSSQFYYCLLSYYFPFSILFKVHDMDHWKNY